MSPIIRRLQLIRQAPLRPLQKLVLLMLSDHIGSRDEWFIKQNDLAQECGFNNRQYLNRVLQQLRDLKLV
jgi:hypothetical protein